jgi:hypothetical protein
MKRKTEITFFKEIKPGTLFMTAPDKFGLVIQTEIFEEHSEVIVELTYLSEGRNLIYVTQSYLNDTLLTIPFE